MSRVFIVIPCLNDDLEDAKASVQSARDQTHEDIDIIVVDDGSTRRGTLTTMNTLRGVRLIRQGNDGTGLALNSGIRVAAGEFILPLGADGLIVKDLVPLLLGIMQQLSADVVAAHPKVEFIGEAPGVATTPEVILLDFLMRNEVVVSALHRRQHWELRGRYGELIDCSKDWCFWAALLETTQTLTTLESPARFHYRIRPGSRDSVNRAAERIQHGRRPRFDALSYRLSEMSSPLPSKPTQPWLRRSAVWQFKSPATPATVCAHSLNARSPTPSLHSIKLMSAIQPDVWAEPCP